MVSDEDWTRLRHGREAAQEALGFVKGMGYREFQENRLVQCAVLRCLEVLGESLGKVGEDTRRSNPEIPWRQVVDLRNRLIHGYYDINLKLVWRSLSDEIPPLLERIDRLLR